MSGNAYFSSGVCLADANITTIGVAEKDAAVIAEIYKTKKTQLTIYIEPTLGSHTGMEFRFYQQHEVGGTWHQVVKQNTSDNTIDDFPAIIDSSTPNGGSIVYNMPLGSCIGFKVTAKGVGAGTDGAARVKVMGRDN